MVPSDGLVGRFDVVLCECADVFKGSGGNLFLFLEFEFVQTLSWAFDN